nr:BTAD domain-containing putative transcriptional regulator [Nocardioides flavescens]
MAFAHAASLAEREDNAQYHSLAVAGEARALIATDPTRAAVLAAQATTLAIPVAHAAPVLAAGWVHLALGDPVRATELADRGAALAGRHRDLPRLADALELAALAARAGGAEPALAEVDPRLREAGDIWRDLANPVRVLTNEVVVARLRRDRVTGSVARGELRSLGVHDDVWRVAGPLHAVARPAAADDVQVRVLGPFAVEVGGVALPAAAWPSRKAREVLGVLACHGDRGLGRERLGALVWPDADAVGNRLSVALSHVRSVLDPDRRLPDSPVLSDGGTVRLDLRHVAVDLVDFTAAAHAALLAAREGSPRGVPLLQGAAALHTGELLDGVDAPGHAEWLTAQREEVELLGREVLQALARVLAAGPEPAEALHWHARLLAHDPYDESTYAALVALLVRLGRYGEARRHHRTYVLRMDELGVPARAWSELAGV